MKKIHQEKRVEQLVDREVGLRYDEIEVGEMVQVALLCTQYLPAHRPKMSEVVRMLEGDGLAEKWAASHSYIHAANSFSSRSKSHSNEEFEHDQLSLFGMTTTMDDDYDAHCMELSGPR